MTSPNYSVDDLRLVVNGVGWVLGTSRLGSTTRLSTADDTPVLTLDDVSSLSLTWETTVEEDLYILPSISRMTISTPDPAAQDLPTRANVTLVYRDEELWTGRLRVLTSTPIKRDGRSTIWVTVLNVDGPEQVLESRTATLAASETFDGVINLMDAVGIAYDTVGSADALGRALAVHLPPHAQLSQSKLAFVRSFAKQTGSGLAGYNHHLGGWQIRHAEDAPVVDAGLLQASDGVLSRLPDAGRLEFVPTRGATEEDPPDYIVFPESDESGLTYASHYVGNEVVNVSPLTTTYTFPEHAATLPTVGKDTNAITEILVPFTEDIFESGILFEPLPWRGVVDFEDGAGDRDITILAVTHEINPEGWLMRMATTRGTLLDRYSGELVAAVGGGFPGEIADIAHTDSGTPGVFPVTWEPTARGFTQNPKVLVAVTVGTLGALNPFWVARDVSMGGVTAWAIVDRSAGAHSFTGLAAGTYTAQVWHLGKAGQSLVHFTDTTVPGLELSGSRYTVGGHSRTVTGTVI